MVEAGQRMDNEMPTETCQRHSAWTLRFQDKIPIINEPLPIRTYPITSIIPFHLTRQLLHNEVLRLGLVLNRRGARVVTH